jgi:hypothetical protein
MSGQLLRLLNEGCVRRLKQAKGPNLWLPLPGTRSGVSERGQEAGAVLECVECGAESDEDARVWRAFLTDRYRARGPGASRTLLWREVRSS